MIGPLGLKAYLAIGKLVGILLLIGIVCYQSSQIHKWHKQADAQSAARQRDHDSYEAAQKQADEKNKAKVAQIEKQQESINEKARSDYARDLDRLRSRTPQGSAGGSKAPGVPQAAPGTHADGLPVAPCDNLCASEIELRLMYLQNWIAEQLKVSR